MATLKGPANIHKEKQYELELVLSIRGHFVH